MVCTEYEDIDRDKYNPTIVIFSPIMRIGHKRYFWRVRRRKERLGHDWIVFDQEEKDIGNFEMRDEYFLFSPIVLMNVALSMSVR